MTVTSSQRPRPGFALIEMDRIVKRPEAAEFLGVSVPTLDRWQCNGTGPAWVQLGGRRGGYTLRALVEFVQARAAAPRKQRAA